MRTEPPIWADPYLTHRRNIANATRPRAMLAIRNAAGGDGITPHLAALLADIVTAGAWRADAACRGMNVDTFFPTRQSDIAEPRAVCADCPVATECRQWADDASELGGVWGGDHTERRVARRSVISGGSQRSELEPDTFTAARAACIDCRGDITAVMTPARRRCDPCQIKADYARKMRWKVKNGSSDAWSKWQVSA